jgi:hypothetical protein
MIALIFMRASWGCPVDSVDAEHARSFVGSHDAPAQQRRETFQVSPVVHVEPRLEHRDAVTPRAKPR